MAHNKKHASHTEALEKENEELKISLGECQQLLTTLTQFALLGARNVQQWANEQGIEQRLDTIQRVFSAIRDMVIVSDIGEKLLSANPRTVEILGYDPTGLLMERLIGDLNLRLRNGSAIEEDEFPLKRALRGHTIFDRDFLMNDSQGLEHAVSVCATPLFSQGKVIGGVAVVRDETDLQSMLKRVQLERAALQAIIDSAPEGIVVVNRNGRMTMANPAAEHLYDQPAPKGQPMETQGRMGLCYPDGQPYDAEDLPLSRSVLHGETVSNVELMLLKKNGAKRFLLANASPIMDHQGRINGAVGIFRDVTNLREDRLRLSADRDDLREQVNLRTAELQATIRALEAQIAERRSIEDQLMRSQKALKRLSRHTLETLENDRRKMAKELHDGIGASLSAIKFIVEEQQAQLENSTSNLPISLRPIINHLTDTIKETKSISARLRPSTLDDLGLRATLSWYCREFAAYQDEIKIEHQIDIDEEQIPEDYKIVVYRIVQEAMNNAAKHAQPSLIRIVIDRHNDYIRLVVQDNGTGFSLKKVISSDDPLSGYGLQSMRERTEISGGSFEIDSQIGLGTRVKVLLPLVQA